MGLAINTSQPRQKQPNGVELMPFELWDSIFEYLSTDKHDGRRAILAFASCSRACRYLSYERLFRVVDLRPKKIHQSEDTQDGSMTRLQSLLKHSPLEFVRHLKFHGKGDERIGAWEMFMTKIGEFRVLVSITLSGMTLHAGQIRALHDGLVASCSPLRSFSIERTTLDVDPTEQDELLKEPKWSQGTSLNLKELRWIANNGSGVVDLFLQFLTSNLTAITIYQTQLEIDLAMETLSTNQFPALCKFEATVYGGSEALSKFLSRHPSLQQLELPTFTGELSLDDHCLPNLQRVKGHRELLAQIIPGRPVQEVEWVSWYALTTNNEHCEEVQSYLRQSTSQIITRLHLPSMYLKPWSAFMNDLVSLKAFSIQVDPAASIISGLVDILKKFKYLSELVVYASNAGTSKDKFIREAVLTPLQHSTVEYVKCIWAGVKEYQKLDANWKLVHKCDDTECRI